MTYDDTSGRSRLTPASENSELDRTDRILVGSCAAIWLVALGAGVAATVALVNLGSGSAESSADSGTPWFLYTVIGVSAVVIIAAVPLLLRARREALADTPRQERTADSPAPGGAGPAGGPALTGDRAAGSGPRGSGASFAAPREQRTPDAADPEAAAVDQLWLRCAVVLACAIGVAMVAIGVATYLLTTDSTVAAWVFYALAALVALAMPAVPWFYFKELRALLDQQSA